MRRGSELFGCVCAVSALMLALCGCETLSNYFGPFSEPTPASEVSPVMAPRPTATPEPTPTPEPRRRSRVHTPHAPGDSAEPAVPNPNAIAPTITLDNDQAARQRAQGLLDSAHAKLGKVDRSRLTGDDAATYAQAASFADAAQHALGEHDYVAATGLAEKASVLADKVTAAAPTPSQTGF